ncbi:MAG: hypothetical protein JNK19_15930 [Tabrizicola sp.]|nr:hypothetical protein [Tabrizicola sp.]
MRIVYHLGAHCTDEDRLIRCLLKNRALLAEEGIIVPSPTRYRKLLRDTAVQLRGAAAPEETQAVILDQIMEETQAERLILSWENFMSFPVWAVTNQLYEYAGERLHAFAQIFPEIEAEFHLAIRNPATLLPGLKAKIMAKGQNESMVESDPLQLSWAGVVRQIIRINPGIPVTVWCDEDVPLVWPEVLQAVSGHSDALVLQDTDEILSQIMTEIGMNRMRDYLAQHPPRSVAQRRRVVSAFLEKFARPEQIEIEVDMPGWDEALIAQLQQNYEADIAEIRGMPWVRFIDS